MDRGTRESHNTIFHGEVKTMRYEVTVRMKKDLAMPLDVQYDEIVNAYVSSALK